MVKTGLAHFRPDKRTIIVHHPVLALTLGDAFLMPHFQKHARDSICKCPLKTETQSSVVSISLERCAVLTSVPCYSCAPGLNRQKEEHPEKGSRHKVHVHSCLSSAPRGQSCRAAAPRGPCRALPLALLSSGLRALGSRAAAGMRPHLRPHPPRQPCPLRPLPPCRAPRGPGAPGGGGRKSASHRGPPLALKLRFWRSGRSLRKRGARSFTRGFPTLNS